MNKGFSLGSTRPDKQRAEAFQQLLSMLNVWRIYGRQNGVLANVGMKYRQARDRLIELNKLRGGK